jgi:MFS family permease
MLADLFPMGKRADAFALIRMARNIGVAAGPAIGGFVLTQSYSFGMYGAAGGLILYGLMLLFFARETLPKEASMKNNPAWAAARLLGCPARPAVHGPGRRLHPGADDGCPDLGAVSVYLKTNFGISEQLYGWLPTTNALMVVFFQVLVTRYTKEVPRCAGDGLGCGLSTSLRR